MITGYKENKRRYVLAYQKEHYTTVVFHLRRGDDIDILEKLDSVPNKSSYIKELIRKDIKDQ